MKNWKELCIGWEALVVLAILLLVNGAFSSQQLVPIAIGVSIVVFIVVSYRLLTKTATFSLNWLTLACWGIAFSYGLSLSTTLSIENSLLKILEWFTYGLLLLGIPPNYSKNANQIIRLFSIVFIIIHIGILLRVIVVPDGLLLLEEGLSVGGLRLNGIIQYANATGAIAAALLLYTMYAHTLKTKWHYMDWGILCGLAFVLFATESRGTLIVLGISFVIGLAVMKHQLHYFVLFICSLSVGIVAYSVMTVMSASVVSVLWAIGMLVIASVLLEKYLPTINKGWAAWILPSVVIGLVLFAGLISQLGILPKAIQDRLTLSTFDARLIYMQDAWQAIQDFWLLGAGGEAWQFAVYQYQQTAYIANDIHMFYEQHWLETGIVGLLLLLVMLIVGIVIVGKQQAALLPAILMLLLHACIDFTLSFGVAIILLLLFIYEGVGEKAQCNWRTGLAIIPAVLVSGIVLIGAVIWQQAENAFQQFALSYHQEDLARAIDKNPYATRYYEALALVDEPLAMYEKIIQYEPQHSKYWFYAAQQYIEIGEFDTAIHYFEKALMYDRFDRQKYELASKALEDIGSEEALALKEKLASQLNEMERLAEASKIGKQRGF